MKRLIPILILLILASTAKSTLCDGLIAYWPLDETSGLTYSEDINGHDGYMGTTDISTKYIAGKLGYALQNMPYNLGGCITDPCTQGIQGTTAETIAFWIQTPSTTVTNGLLIANTDGFWYGGGGGWSIWIGYQGGYKIFFSVAGYENWCASAPQSVLAGNVWHLVVCDFNVAASPMAKIYVDNVAADNWNSDSVITALPETVEVGIFPWIYDSGHPDVAVDEIVVWNRALSVADINDLWNDGNGIAVGEITLTYIAGANGSITGDTSQTLTCFGADGAEVTAVPDGGYAFSIWSDGVLTAARTDVNVVADINVTALFAAPGIPSRSLTISETGCGIVVYPSSDVFWADSGTVQTITTEYMPMTCVFVNWTGTAVTEGKVADPNSYSTTVTMDANYTICANFIDRDYTLTYTAGANGSITGTSPQTVDYGEDGNAVSAVNDVNYHFVNWSDGSTENPRQDVNVTGDVNVVANFATTLSRSLQIWAVGDGQISVPGTGTFWYDNNSEANIIAAANTGYTFAGWFGSGKDKITDINAATTKILMDANYTAVAFFNTANGITMTPFIANFGIVPVGSYSDVNVTVKNDGDTVQTVPISIGTSFYGYYTVASPSPFTIVGDTTLVLGPNSISDTNDTCIMTLRYTPTVANWVWGPLYATVNGQVYAQMYMSAMGYSVPFQPILRLECFFCTEQ